MVLGEGNLIFVGLIGNLLLRVIMIVILKVWGCRDLRNKREKIENMFINYEFSEIIGIEFLFILYINIIWYMKYIRMEIFKN